MKAFRIQIIATGGTLAKSYDPQTGRLVIDNTIVDALLAELRLPDCDVATTHLLAKDSLEMGASDRETILDAVHRQSEQVDAVIVVHGTDTLCRTSRLLAEKLTDLSVPVVVTGAMVPHACAGSDARQNMSQAIMACRLLAPGVHVVFHGRALDGGRATKNYGTLTFEPTA